MRKKRTPWKRFWRWATPIVAPPLAVALLRALYATLRIRFVGLEHAIARWERGEPTIFVFWHGRMLLMPTAFRGRRLAIIISSHEDGRIIARTMERLGFEWARGSSTRGGAVAAKQALRVLREGGDVAITPDGPRGPRFRVQEGAVELARLSGAPIVALSYSARRAKVFGSWDRFILPAPFSSCVVLMGAPHFVPREASPEESEAARQRVERELRRLTEEADAAFARETPEPGAARAGARG